jgi:hypothetical protein
METAVPYMPIVAIYLAARYSRRLELVACKGMLEELAGGHAYRITSRWLDGNHQVSEATPYEATKEQRERFALEDWEDLMSADWCISFTEKPREQSTSRGGRHVEFGGALARGKRCIVIGHRENVFHCMPGVEFFADFGSFLLSLASASKTPT